MNLRHVSRSLLLLFYHQSYLQSSNWRNCHHQSYPVIEFRIPSRKLIKSHTFLLRRYVHHVELNRALVQLGTKVSYVATKPLVWWHALVWLLTTQLWEREREDSFMRNRYMFFPSFTRNIPSRKLIKSHTFLSRCYVHHVGLNIAPVQLGTKVSYAAAKPLVWWHALVWLLTTQLCEREREDSFMHNRYMFFHSFTRNISSRKLIKSRTFLSRRYIHHVGLNIAPIQLGTKVSYAAAKPLV